MLVVLLFYDDGAWHTTKDSWGWFCLPVWGKFHHQSSQTTHREREKENCRRKYFSSKKCKDDDVECDDDVLELKHSFPLLCLSSQELQWEEGGDEKNKHFSQAWFIRLLCSLNVAIVDDETRILCIHLFSLWTFYAMLQKEESRSAAPSSLSSKPKSVVSSGNTERVQERHEKFLSTFSRENFSCNADGILA